MLTVYVLLLLLLCCCYCFSVLLVYLVLVWFLLFRQGLPMCSQAGLKLMTTPSRSLMNIPFDVISLMEAGMGGHSEGGVCLIVQRWILKAEASTLRWPGCVKKVAFCPGTTCLWSGVKTNDAYVTGTLRDFAVSVLVIRSYSAFQNCWRLSPS